MLHWRSHIDAHFVAAIGTEAEIVVNAEASGTGRTCGSNAHPSGADC